MLTAHHVNAFLLIAVCVLASAAAFWARRARAGSIVAQLLALAQTLLVAQVALGLLLLSDHHRAEDHLHYAYGTFALLAVLSPGSTRRPSRGHASCGSRSRLLSPPPSAFALS